MKTYRQAIDQRISDDRAKMEEFSRKAAGITATINENLSFYLAGTHFEANRVRQKLLEPMRYDLDFIAGALLNNSAITSIVQQLISAPGTQVSWINDLTKGAKQAILNMLDESAQSRLQTLKRISEPPLLRQEMLGLTTARR
jgi:hypothetical protein